MGINNFCYVIYVSSYGMFVNNETKAYDTYSSSASNGGKRFYYISKRKCIVNGALVFTKRP